MKRLTTLAIAILFSSGLWAQQKSAKAHKNMSADEKTELMIERMTQNLELTAEQKESLSPLLKDFLQNREDERAKARNYRTEFKDSLRGILSPAQLEKLEARMKKRQQQMRWQGKKQKQQTE